MEGESEAKPRSEIVKSVVTANLSSIPDWQLYGVPMSGDRSIIQVLVKSHGFTKVEISKALRELGVVPRTVELASKLRRKELREILSKLLANNSPFRSGPIQVRGAGGLMEKVRALGVKDNHQVVTEELVNCGFALKHRYDDANDPRFIAALSRSLNQQGITPPCVIDSNMVGVLHSDLSAKGQGISLARLKPLLESLNIQIRSCPAFPKQQLGGKKTRAGNVDASPRMDPHKEPESNPDIQSAVIYAAIQDELKTNPLWREYGVPKGKLIQTIRQRTGCGVLAAQTAVASMNLPSQGQAGRSRMHRDRIKKSIHAVLTANPQLRQQPIIVRGENGIMPLLRSAGCSSNHAVVSSVLKELGLEIAGLKDPRFVALSRRAERVYPNKWLKSSETIKNVKARVLFDTSFETQGATTAQFRTFLAKTYPDKNVESIHAATLNRFMKKVGVSCLPSMGGHWGRECRTEVDNAIMNLGIPLDTLTIEKVQTLLAERGIHRCIPSVINAVQRVRQSYRSPELRTGS